MQFHIFATFNGLAAPGQMVLPQLILPSGTAVLWFFSLSGFVLWRSRQRHPHNVKTLATFYGYRILRIYPLYWLGLLLVAPLLCNGVPWSDIVETVNHMAWLWPLTRRFEWIPTVWTLRYEIAFYLVFGLTFLPFIGVPILVGWLTLLLWVSFPTGLTTFGLNIPVEFIHLANGTLSHLLSCLDLCFFVGIGIAIIARRVLLPVPVAIALPAIAAGLASIVWPEVDDGRLYGTPHELVYLCPALAMTLFALVSLEQRGTLRLPPICGYLGKLSYPVYLFHMPITSWIVFLAHAHHLSRERILELEVVNVIATLALSVIADRMFDRPFQRLAVTGLSRASSRAALLLAKGRWLKASINHQDDDQSASVGNTVLSGSVSDGVVRPAAVIGS